MDHDPQSFEDVAVARACAAGDATARYQAFHKFYPRLLRFFANKVAKDRVEDLINETFVRLFDRGFAGYSGQGRLVSFVLGVAYRCMLEEFRVDGRVKHDNDAGAEAADPIRPSPSRVLAQGQRHRLLRAALRSLPPKFQHCLEVYYWNHLTTAEVADVLRVPVGTVRARLKRGRELLMQRLEETGFDPSEWIEMSNASHSTASPSDQGL